MHVLLTGATGFIGSSILQQLVAGGHQVTAPVRDASKADAIGAAGGTGVVTDFSDRARLVELMRAADAVVHTAAATDDAEGFDRGVAEAAIEALGGTGKPYVHTGGVWVWGEGDSITESDPMDPPAVTAWRVRVQALLETADLPLTVVHPGIVYGYGKGIPAIITGAPRTDDGRLLTVGSGEQHWTTIHVDDLAALYIAVLEAGSGFDAVLGVGDESPRVRELSEAVAGAAGVATEQPEATLARLGDGFGEALLLDQQASNAKARAIGGWAPTRPSLVEELRATSA